MSDAPTGGKTVNFSAPVSTGRRERAPKSTTVKPKVAASKETVDAALIVMQSAYAVLGLGLMTIAGPRTAELFADATDDLQTSNKQAFESSPKLAAMIAQAGAVSGVGIFVGAHVMALAPVVLSFRQERSERRFTKEKEKAERERSAATDYVA